MRIGTCGMPVSWSKYTDELPVMEVQKTFYSPMNIKTAERWRKRVPPNFEFTLKAPQAITHPPSSPTYRRYKGHMGDFGYFKLNEDTKKAWSNFVKIAKVLNAKVVVFQSPPSFRENEENLERIEYFFSAIDREFVFGWEPRGTWEEKTVMNICKKLELIHVVDPFKNRSTYGPFKYYRLHGIGGYRYSYSFEDLKLLAGWVNEGDYVMFNNTDMWKNALDFKKIIENQIETFKSATS